MNAGARFRTPQTAVAIGTRLLVTNDGMLAPPYISVCRACGGPSVGPRIAAFQRLYGDNGDQGLEAYKVLGVARVQRQFVGVGDRCDEEVRNAGAVRTPGCNDRSDDLAIASRAGGVEFERLKVTRPAGVSPGDELSRGARVSCADLPPVRRA